jgi:hypothetical protein
MFGLPRILLCHPSPFARGLANAMDEERGPNSSTNLAALSGSVKNRKPRALS